MVYQINTYRYCHVPDFILSDRDDIIKSLTVCSNDGSWMHLLLEEKLSNREHLTSYIYMYVYGSPYNMDNLMLNSDQLAIDAHTKYNDRRCTVSHFFILCTANFYH